jgi:hypothetical protein
LVDDQNRIPRHDMRDRVMAPEALPAAWPDSLPKVALNVTGCKDRHRYRLQNQSDNPSQELDSKRWAGSKHNILDARCIQAQADIRSLNLSWLAQPALLFGDGWTVGARLQQSQPAGLASAGATPQVPDLRPATATRGAAGAAWGVSINHAATVGGLALSAWCCHSRLSDHHHS